MGGGRKEGEKSRENRHKWKKRGSADIKRQKTEKSDLNKEKLAFCCSHCFTVV